MYIIIIFCIRQDWISQKCIRNRYSKKDRQYNDDKNEKDKRTNNSLQNTTLKVKDRAIQIPLNTEGELR